MKFEAGSGDTYMHKDDIWLGPGQPSRELVLVGDVDCLEASLRTVLKWILGTVSQI